VQPFYASDEVNQNRCQAIEIDKQLSTDPARRSKGVNEWLVCWCVL
jgi:hypothetical protein